MGIFNRKKPKLIEQDKEVSFMESFGVQPCTPEAYAKWLSTYIMNGGSVTGFQRSLNWSEYGVATKQPKGMPLMHGAKPIRLIIPEEIDSSPLLVYKNGFRTGVSRVNLGMGDNTEYINVDLGMGNNRVYGFYDGIAWTSEDTWVACDPDVIELLELTPEFWEALDQQLSDFDKEKGPVYRLEHLRGHLEDLRRSILNLDPSSSPTEDLEREERDAKGALRLEAEFRDIIDLNRKAIASMMR